MDACPILESSPGSSRIGASTARLGTEYLVHHFSNLAASGLHGRTLSLCLISLPHRHTTHPRIYTTIPGGRHPHARHPIRPDRLTPTTTASLQASFLTFHHLQADISQPWTPFYETYNLLRGNRKRRRLLAHLPDHPVFSYILAHHSAPSSTPYEVSKGFFSSSSSYSYLWGDGSLGASFLKWLAQTPPPPSPSNLASGLARAAAFPPASLSSVRPAASFAAVAWPAKSNSLPSPPLVFLSPPVPLSNISAGQTGGRSCYLCTPYIQFVSV